MLVPRLRIVTSDLRFIVRFVERPGSKEDVFEKLDRRRLLILEIDTFALSFSHIIRYKERKMLTKYRYLVSKLLEVFFVRELASRICSAAKASETPVILN